MRRTIYALLFVYLQPCLLAQDFTRTELGIESSTLFQNRLANKLDSGLGGRFTYNFTPSLALETSASYYPTNSGTAGVTTQDGGTAISVLAGVKAGIRRRKFGVFFKARPGILSFSDAGTSTLTTARKTHAALDLGGVLEFYPSARIVLRLDAGNMLARYGEATLFASAVTPVFSIGSINNPYHLTLGVGYRIGELQGQQENAPVVSRLDFGLQYSLLSLERTEFVVRDESSVGGFLTYNLTSHFSLDASASFFPREHHFVDFQEGGQIIQAVAGIRWGIRRDHWGAFAKFRPGVQIYTLTSGFDFRQVFDPGQKLPSFANLALDEGGVFEIYTSKHTMLRFDAGDTVIHFRQRNFLDEVGNPFKVPGFNKASIQLTAGFGLRF
jgi:hypothetical protein